MLNLKNFIYYSESDVKFFIDFIVKEKSKKEELLFYEIKESILNINLKNYDISFPFDNNNTNISHHGRKILLKHKIFNFEFCILNYVGITFLYKFSLDNFIFEFEFDSNNNYKGFYYCVNNDEKYVLDYHINYDNNEIQEYFDGFSFDYFIVKDILNNISLPIDELKNFITLSKDFILDNNTLIFLENLKKIYNQIASYNKVNNIICYN